MSDTKPLFVIKENLQKTRKTNNSFKDLLTKDVLRDICEKVLQQKKYDLKYVDNAYVDSHLEKGPNKGRLAILYYQGAVHYITFSEKNIGGRDSSVQSVGPAYERFLRNKGTQFHYYFLNKAHAETDYQLFMYRLMESIGVNFLNGKFAPFTSLDDVYFFRKSNRDKGKANDNPSYITKENADTFEVYGKVYGANKYAVFMICYAMSKIASPNQNIFLYEMQDKGLRELPKPALNVLKQCSNVIIEKTDQSMDRKVIESDDNNIRNPRFIYNLLKNLGEKKCAFCTCDIPEIIDGAHILEIASIKKENISKEKKIKKAVDPYNGLWLCKNHHKLFDSGFIQVLPNGQILYGNDLGYREKYIKEITTMSKLESKVLKPEFLSYLRKRNALSR